MKKAKNEFQPMFTTIVNPSEYDIDGQIKDAIRLANKHKECYVSFDVGKLVGLYFEYKKLLSENESLRYDIETQNENDAGLDG